jgi:hypothetical protein
MTRCVVSSTISRGVVVTVEEFEDGDLKLADGRVLAWRVWGHRSRLPVLRLQGTPGSRLLRYPHPDLWAQHGVRM